VERNVVVFFDIADAASRAAEEDAGKSHRLQEISEVLPGGGR
jgi:hypothetical protein